MEEAGNAAAAAAGLGIGEMIAAIAALGVAAQGLVDTSKFFNGGISRAGLGYIREALAPFARGLEVAAGPNPFTTIEANWINGVPKDEQKQATLNLIRLGLTGTTADGLALDVESVDGPRLQTVAEKLEAGEKLEESDLALLARFDSVVDVRLSAAYERADQYYRNSAKLAAGVVSLFLSLLVVAASPGITGYRGPAEFMVALLIGLIAVPLAPVSKDLTSAISTAVKALKLGKA